MSQNLFEWTLLLVRWVHIVAGISWIGESIYFMWLDRSLVKNPENKHPGHVGELWMVHGGGFYKVDKLLIGPTKVPKDVHWFKWEAFSTWVSGMLLLVLIFYTGGGTFLLDENVSDITYGGAVALSLGCIFGSWFLYDFLWERKFAQKGYLGHFITLVMFFALTWILTHTLSGRAAYIHMAGIMGTWMVGNVWMRILPRQQKMIDASERGEEVNQEWGVNAKFRSTHNTYFTLPVIFIMISNHFPSTYGHDKNWLILILICIAGAVVRQYFIMRESLPAKARFFLVPAFACFFALFNMTLEMESYDDLNPTPAHKAAAEKVKEFTKAPEPKDPPVINGTQTTEKRTENNTSNVTGNISGSITFTGTPPTPKVLRLPGACMKNHKGEPVLDNVRLVGNKLENVLIRISNGLDGKEFDRTVPTDEVVLDQIGCIYIPRVTAARVGQKVRFKNSDPIFHNVKTFAKNNKKFNTAMPEQNSSFVKVFDQPEFSISAKCSLHPWMSAFIGVFDHPFFDVSDANGSFDIKNLPAGTYTVEAWHEVFGKLEKEIVVDDNNTEIKLDFEFK
jgi:uncharacterized membrane protein/plastocyanin